MTGQSFEAFFWVGFIFFLNICSVSCCPWRHIYPLLNYAALPREWLCSWICSLQYGLRFLPVYVYFHAIDVIRKLHLPLSCYFEQGSSDTSLKTQEIICVANQNFHNWICIITNFSKAVLLWMLFFSLPLFCFEQDHFLSASKQFVEIKKEYSSLFYTDYILLC